MAVGIPKRAERSTDAHARYTLFPFGSPAECCPKVVVLDLQAVQPPPGVALPTQVLPAPPVPGSSTTVVDMVFSCSGRNDGRRIRDSRRDRATGLGVDRGRCRGGATACPLFR